MKLNRKAQGLSLNTIIIAILVIIVLVVIVLIFMGRIRIFGSSVQSCSEKGGTCDAQARECYTPEGVWRADVNCKCSLPNSVIIPGTDCPSNGICCQQLY